MRHDMIRPLDSAIQVTVFSCSRESEKVCMFYYNICCSQFQQHHYRKHDENMFNSVHSSVFIIITLVMSLLCRCFSMATNSEVFQVPSTSSWASWPAQRWQSWVFDRFAFDIGSLAVLGGWIGREDFLKTPLGSSEWWHQPVRLLTTRGEGSCDLCFSRNVELQSHSDAACKQDTPLHRANHPVPSHPDFRFHTTWATASSNPINFQLPMDVDGYSNSKIIITCYHQICWFGLPLLAFTHWCLCMVSFLPESCHCLAISRWNPRRGTSLNIVSTREHSPRLNCEDLPTWVTKTHSLHLFARVTNSASSGKIKAKNIQRTMDVIEPERIWMK